MSHTSLDLGEVGREVLAHGEGAELLLAEHLGHLGVGGEELLVGGVLELVLLEVGPELLDALGAGGLLLAHDGGEVGGELHGLGDAVGLLSLRHGDEIWWGSWGISKRKFDVDLRRVRALE